MLIFFIFNSFDLWSCVIMDGWTWCFDVNFMFFLNNKISRSCNKCLLIHSTTSLRLLWNRKHSQNFHIKQSLIIITEFRSKIMTIIDIIIFKFNIIKFMEDLLENLKLLVQNITKITVTILLVWNINYYYYKFLK